MTDTEVHSAPCDMPPPTPSTPLLSSFAASLSLLSQFSELRVYFNQSRVGDDCWISVRMNQGFGWSVFYVQWLWWEQIQQLFLIKPKRILPFHKKVSHSSLFIITIWAYQWQKQTLSVDVHWWSTSSWRDYIAACFMSARCSALIQHWKKPQNVVAWGCRD